MNKMDFPFNHPNISYRGDNIPPPSTNPPRKKIWILENIKTPEKKFAREARENFWAFFRLFFKAKWCKNGQSMENIKTPSRTFWEIWKILKPREKKSEISSLRGGFNIIPPVMQFVSLSLERSLIMTVSHLSRGGRACEIWAPTDFWRLRKVILKNGAKNHF